MENKKVSQRILDHIAISFYCTIAYAVLLMIYLSLPLGAGSDFLLILFIACSLLLSIAAITFACKSYKNAKLSSLLLIIINSLGLSIPLLLLLLLST
ncbi:hypothetical protein [Chryseobacterium pennipullorum]|uniref:Uncharacterized protein n=1 Tax=Chryseobacterium pennipullorum TaxID=2258963 RepID=A0A3D9B0W1_9FLAO|nr:hypothetical protein [Chryseobacterium pennipullorum]REC47274.1 hypothetical protein DRF67_11700 [Chryseobacterium pennipullorum]